MKIHHYGEVLVGCVDCNRWGRPGDKKLIMEMPEDDLKALRERKEKAFAALARASKADWGIRSKNESCVYRKPIRGRSSDEVRQGSRVS
jgi:hypothetical protein